MPPTFWCDCPHTANPLALPVGRKPPWNQPQVTPLSFSRSPMFLPSWIARLSVAVWFLSEQSSYAGSGSLITVPTPLSSGEVTKGSDVGSCVTDVTACVPWVWPEMRLIAPGVDGPNVVLYELSLIA